MMNNILFIVSLVATFTTAISAGMDPKLSNYPTLMFFVSIVFAIFTCVFYHTRLQ